MKFCDFNLSGTDEILEDTLQGTAFYIAPEIILNGFITEKSDFWSLGVLLFFLYFKKYPFIGKNRTEMFFKIVNRIFEPEIFEAEENLKKIIFDLLNIDHKKRLGNNLFEFIEHPFFVDFDWNSIFCNEFKFSFDLKKLKIFYGKVTDSQILELKKDYKRNFQFCDINDFSFSESQEG